MVGRGAFLTCIRQPQRESPVEAGASAGACAPWLSGSVGDATGVAGFAPSSTSMDGPRPAASPPGSGSPPRQRGSPQRASGRRTASRTAPAAGRAAGARPRS
eukprot:7827245-Alexandrium_andersonii.AAC.1